MRGSVADVFFVPIIILATFVAMITAFTLYVKGANFLGSHVGTITYEVNGQTYQLDTKQMYLDDIKLWDYLLAGILLGIYGAFIFSLSRLPVIKESLPAWLLIGLISFWAVFMIHQGILGGVDKLSQKNNDLATALTYIPITGALVNNLPMLHIVFWIIGTIVFYGKERMSIRVGGGGLSW